MALVEQVEVKSVADLYFRFATMGHHYEGDDNPLYGLTRVVPAKAQYFAVAPVTDIDMTYRVMKALAGRRKLRQVEVTKDEINFHVFAPTDRLVVFYA